MAKLIFIDGKPLWGLKREYSDYKPLIENLLLQINEARDSAQEAKDALYWLNSFINLHHGNYNAGFPVTPELRKSLCKNRHAKQRDAYANSARVGLDGLDINSSNTIGQCYADHKLLKAIKRKSKAVK